MINRVCKRCNIALDISNSVEWGEVNFRYCRDCVEAMQNAERAKPTFPIDAISDLRLSFHEFFIDKFLGHHKPSLQPFRYLKMVEIIELYYEIKNFRDITFKPVQEPETFTYETHPKYYRLKEKKKYKKLYKYYPYEYVSIFLEELGLAIEEGPARYHKNKAYPSGSRHCYLHIDEEIIDVNKAKSPNSKYKSCENDECLRFLNITENPVENEYCWLCTD